MPQEFDAGSSGKRSGKLMAALGSGGWRLLPPQNPFR
jgi:hypothetical protein